MNKRRAARLDKSRRFRKALFNRGQAIKIWGAPVATLARGQEAQSDIRAQEKQAEAPTKGRHMAEAHAYKFIMDFVETAKQEGRIPTQVDLEEAAKEAGWVGGRDLRRTTLKDILGANFTGRGRPRKSPS